MISILVSLCETMINDDIEKFAEATRHLPEATLRSILTSIELPEDGSHLLAEPLRLRGIGPETGVIFRNYSPYIYGHNWQKILPGRIEYILGILEWIDKEEPEEWKDCTAI